MRAGQQKFRAGQQTYCTAINILYSNENDIELPGFTGIFKLQFKSLLAVCGRFIPAILEKPRAPCVSNRTVVLYCS